MGGGAAEDVVMAAEEHDIVDAAAASTNESTPAAGAEQGVSHGTEPDTLPSASSIPGYEDDPDDLGGWIDNKAINAKVAEKRPHTFGFSTFGTEPIGPNSWKLNSPRSLEICKQTGILPESLKPQPFETFHCGGVPFEVARIRCRAAEDMRIQSLKTARHMWFAEITQNSESNLKNLLGQQPRRDPSFSTAQKMRREREMKLLAHEKHRHRVFTKQRVDTLDNYMSAAQKQEQAAERSGNRVAADVERKRIEKANAAKMVEMRQRQKAAREEREVAEKYRALMEQEEREVQEAEEAALQALMNQRELIQQQHLRELQVKAAEKARELHEQDLRRQQRFDEQLAIKKASNKRKAQAGHARVQVAVAAVAAQQQKIKDDFENKQNRLEVADRMKKEKSKVDGRQNRQACLGKKKRNKERIEAVKQKEVEWVRDLVEQRTIREVQLDKNHHEKQWQSTLQKEEVELKRKRKKLLVQQWKRADDHKAAILLAKQAEEDFRLDQMKKFESKMRHEQQMRSNGRKAEMDYLSTNLLSVQVSQDYSRLQTLKPLDSARSMRHTMPAGLLQTVVDRAESRAASCIQLSSTISGAMPQVVDMYDF